MVNIINKYHILAYNELLEKVPHLKNKIESGKLFNNDINAIARSVFIREMDNGSFSIENKISEEDKERYTKTLNNQQTLIRRICSVSRMQPSEIQQVNQMAHENTYSIPVEKPVTANNEEQVDITRKNKRKSPEEDIHETKKIKLEKTESEVIAEELIDILANSPNVIQKTILEHLGQIPSLTEHFIELIREGKDLGHYSSITELNLSEVPNLNLERKEFTKIISAFKHLKSLTLPKNDISWPLQDITQNCPDLESLSLVSGARMEGLENLKKLKSLTIVSQSIKNIRFLLHHLELIDLNLSACWFIPCNDTFEKLSDLKNLNLSRTFVTDINFLNNSFGLENLNLSKCMDLNNIDSIRNCISLKSLDLSDCESLRDISALGNCLALESLNLKGCTSLEDLSILETLPNLKNIEFP